MSNYADPAFPLANGSRSGLTKREYAAIILASGALADAEAKFDNQHHLARWAVGVADALLEELAK